MVNGYLMTRKAYMYALLKWDHSVRIQSKHIIFHAGVKRLIGKLDQSFFTAVGRNNITIVLLMMPEHDN